MQVRKLARGALIAIAAILGTAISQSSFAAETLPGTLVNVTAGTIDMKVGQRIAEFRFARPYKDGSRHWILYRYAAPCDPDARKPPRSYKEHLPIWYSFGDPEGYAGPCLAARQEPNQGGRVRSLKGAPLRVVFTIPHWDSGIQSPDKISVEVHLGSQKQVAKFGTPEIAFDNVPAGVVPLTLIIHGGLFVGDKPESVKIPGILPLYVQVR
jgi:hypothetical protein